MQYPLPANVAPQLNADSILANKSQFTLQTNTSPAAYPAPALTLTYSVSQKYFEAVWQRPVTSQEYCQLIRFVGMCIAVLRAEYVLVDFSNMGAPSEQDQHTTTLFLQKALNNTTLKRSARVLGTNEEQARVYQAITENSPILPYNVQVFHSVSAARQWLFAETPEQAKLSGNGTRIPLNCSLRDLKKLAVSETDKKDVAAPLQQKEYTPISRCLTSFAEIIVDRERSLITLRWLRKVTSREYRYGILKASRGLLEHQVKKALINYQRMGVLTLEDQAWLATQSATIISRSKLEKLAIVNSTDVIQQMASEKINLRIRKSFTNYCSEYFITENDAMYWLFTPQYEL